jgi:hypothetical protein
LSDTNLNNNDELAKFLRDNDLIFRIGSPNSSVSEKLQLLTLKLLIILWEKDDEDDLEKMEEKLRIIDDVRHELAFLRARYYKQIFSNKAGLKF